MIHKLKIMCLVLAVTLVSSCELDLLENPNAVNTSNADVNFLLNSVILSYAGNFNGFSGPGMSLTRMLNQGAAIYDNAVTPGSSDGRWNNSYSGILADVATIIPLAEKSELFIHAGIARTIRASVLMNLVDAFGDVPYSEALDPANFNPKADDGASVYAAALADLDQAVKDFNANSKSSPTDLIYNGNKDRWIRAANSLRLKYYLNRRLVDKAGSTAAINAIIAENKLISSAAENFAFKYGSNLTNPDTRHPRYGGQYTPTGGGDYQSNSFMGHLYSSKGFPDPRIRFYFYRQVIKNPTDVNLLRCITNSKPAHYGEADVYCLPTNVGYWGRDHLNNEGIPPDNLTRTAWGLYPAGGLYDDDAGKGVSLGAGAGGAGIHPIMMRSFVDFMLAESVLTLGTTGDARALLKSAVEKSFADVRSLALGSTESSKISAFEAAKGINWATDVEQYVNKVLADYDAATTDDARLNIIATEYWVALYGNGIEAYNLYRRTGKPAGQQPALEPNPGPFVRSYYYPTGYVTRNSNAKQKADVTTQVFWDNNPAGFVK
ncbi:MAG: SusD/RagB family nutrient-binding outer membrane lipoprotein [Saprospiraceae bacterium]|nr:SusD/RagB family nutrient-binding outer membrane lipoprotein [Saprospiraceae bacterium]